MPYFLSQVIGGLSNKDQNLINISLIFAVAAGLIGVIGNYIGFQSLIKHEANVKASLTNSVFRKLMNKDMRFFVNEKIGALTSRFIDFINSETDLQDLLIIKTLGFLLSVITGLIILAFQSIPLAIIVMILIISLIIEVKWSIKKRAPWREARKKITGEIYGSIADSLSNNLIVKTFANEQNEIDNIAEKNNQFRHYFIKDVGFIAAEGTLRIAVMSIVQIVAIGFSISLFMNGQMEIATIIFILTYLQRISTQIFELGNMINGFDQALLKAAPMSDILAIKNYVKDNNNPIELKGIKPTISLRNVTYYYENNPIKILDDISLDIKAGEKIGLIGSSGAGKTTIAHLLLRFSDIQNGTIEIGGNDIKNVSQSSLRKFIGYVPQEPLLFHRTLRENICYGRADATEKEINEAIINANAKDFIDKTSHGLDTIVGERGIKLSGGQRQRIAISRAILKNAPILILDEATSALDSENEKLIQDAISKLMEGKTSIVIAHRLSTISKLDRIIVLDSGKIVEQGKHDELIKQNGIYAKLWNHQSGGFIS